jgi:hypothetical protein
MAKKPELLPTPAASLNFEYLSLLRNVKDKRAKAVIDHILEHGFVTTDELNELYNYDHPPRAARDVRELGVPLITNFVLSSRTGQKIAAYTFDDPTKIKHGRIGGRRAFPKAFKQQLVTLYGSRDTITRAVLEERYLQIDHRVPYEVAGEMAALDPADYMLLDASSQRAKSWSCEHCQNFIELRRKDICATCFWASPETYDHVALARSRRVEIVWSDDEVDDHRRIEAAAAAAGQSIADYIKAALGGK